MEARQGSGPALASLARLDASAGRSGRSEPDAEPTGHLPADRPRQRDRQSRARPLVAGLLVAGLAAGWLVVQRASTNPRPGLGNALRTHGGGAPPTVAPGVPTAALRALLADAGSCADAADAVPAVQCDIDGVRLDARLLTAADARRTYVSSSGARIEPRSGLPECARGLPDERAWSRPETPRVVAGRYRCRIEGDAAAIWWTDEHGVLAHAVARDRDLARLFVWWRAHRNG